MATTKERKFKVYISLILSIILLLDMGVTSQSLSIGYWLNSDILLPADFTELVFRQGYPPGSFQLPRVPSLFPDLLLLVPLQLISGSWRFALQAVGCLQLAGLAVGAGLILRQMLGGRFLRHCALFLLLLLPLMLGELVNDRFDSHLRIILQVVSHGGQFVAGLFAAVLAVASLQSWRPLRLVLLLIVASLCLLSDQLSLLELQAPLLAALLPSLWTRPRLPKLATMLVILASIPLAYWLDASLFDHLLLRQPDLPVDVELVGQHLASWWRDLTAGMILSWVLPSLVIFGAAVMLPRLAGWQGVRQAYWFYCRFALVAMLLPTALAVTLLYQDISYYRYLHTLFWWPPILAAALASRLLGDRQLPRLAPVAALAALAAILLRLPQHMPLPLTWRDPVALCLSRNQDRLPPGAGLASYWNARRLEVALNWQRDIDQIDPGGRIFYWGNDLLRYRPDAARPAHRFVIMTGLDEAEIRQNYGAPDRQMSCPGGDIWIYDNAAMIERTLAASYPPEGPH